MTLLGPQGLKQVAELGAWKAHYLADRLAGIPGVALTFPNTPFLNEFTLSLEADPRTVLDRLAETGFLGGVDLARFGRDYHGNLTIAVTERRTRQQLDAFVEAFTAAVA